MGYQERLRKAGALDFDDLLLEAVRLFEDAPDVLARYQDRWRYLHVDEYPDTNRPQYLWVRALAARYGNLAVVGDDDQSIYRWRGADLRNILDFERDWPNATIVKLDVEGVEVAAFEGAQISCGQRAAPGAIERFRINRETLEPRFKVIGCDLWSDHPDFARQTEATGVTGVCGSGIIECIAEMYLSGILTQDGVIDGGMAAKSPRIQPAERTFSYLLHDGTPQLRIFQNDVRAIQLAKAALYAGARLLMDRMGVDKVDRITLAGAFGSHIDVKYAMVLGMIPDCDLRQVASVGNAAGAGARIALLDASARATIEELVRSVEKIETAIEPRFQAHFVEAMAIPHKTAAYTELRKVVTLPAARASTGPRAPRGRRGASVHGRS